MFPIDIENKSTIENINIYICIYSYISSFWHHIFVIPPTENSGISKSTGWAIIEELSIRRRVRTFLVSWGQTTRVKNCYVDSSSSYEFWFPIIFIDMNVIHGFDCQYVVSTRTSLRIFFFFFLFKYNNSNSSTGECVWINGEQNSQRQESVQQHWPPTPQAESRQLSTRGCLGRFCVHVCSWFVCNWREKFQTEYYCFVHLSSGYCCDHADAVKSRGVK